MLELRRVRAGIFDESKSITLYELENAIKENNLDKYLISGEDALKKIFPVVQVKEESVKRLLTGKSIMEEDIKSGKIKDRFITFFGDKFIGVYEGNKPLFVYQDIKG